MDDGDSRRSSACLEQQADRLVARTKGDQRRLADLTGLKPKADKCAAGKLAKAQMSEAKAAAAKAEQNRQVAQSPQPSPTPVAAVGVPVAPAAVAPPPPPPVPAGELGVPPPGFP